MKLPLAVRYDAGGYIIVDAVGEPIASMSNRLARPWEVAEGFARMPETQQALYDLMDVAESCQGYIPARSALMRDRMQDALARAVRVLSSTIRMRA